MRTIVASAGLLVSMLLAACSSSPKESSPTVATSTAPVAAAPSPTAPSVPDPCTHDGKWALCSIEKRLRQSGFVARKIDSASTMRAGFSVKPTVYSLGRSRLEVFLYKDSVALAKDAAKLDTLLVGPKGSASQWGELPPLLLRSANLFAVILSQDPRQIERASLVITAGPPQPGSPR